MVVSNNQINRGDDISVEIYHLNFVKQWCKIVKIGDFINFYEYSNTIYTEDKSLNIYIFQQMGKPYGEA